MDYSFITNRTPRNENGSSVVPFLASIIKLTTVLSQYSQSDTDG